MPRILNIVGFHTIFKCGIYFALEYILLPNHMAWPRVLSRIQKQARYFSKFINCIYWSFKWFFLPHCSLVVCQSANWNILCSTLFIQIPLLSLSSRIIIAKFSTHKINNVWWYRCRPVGTHGSCCKPLGCLSIHYYRWFYVFIKSIYPSTKVFSKTKCSKIPKHEPPIKRVKRFLKVEA